MGSWVNQIHSLILESSKLNPFASLRSTFFFHTVLDSNSGVGTGVDVAGRIKIYFYSFIFILQTKTPHHIILELFFISLLHSRFWSILGKEVAQGFSNFAEVSNEAAIKACVS